MNNYDHYYDHILANCICTAFGLKVDYSTYTKENEDDGFTWICRPNDRSGLEEIKIIGHDFAKHCNHNYNIKELYLIFNKINIEEMKILQNIFELSEFEMKAKKD